MEPLSSSHFSPSEKQRNVVVAVGRVRAPPQRVMNDRSERDLVSEARRSEDKSKKQADQLFESMKQQEAQKRTVAFEAEDLRRQQVNVDPKSIALVESLLGGPTEERNSPIPKGIWKTPVKKPSTVMSRSDEREALEDFMKATGIYDANKLVSAPNPHHQPSFHASPHVEHHEQRKPSVSSLSAPVSPIPSRPQPTALSPPPVSKSNDKVFDHSGVVNRTLVSRSKTLRHLMKTKPLAPIPQSPTLADTSLPPIGSTLNAESLLTKFKSIQVDEKDYNLDLKTRTMAEEQDGTLIHFELTQSIKRVENIVAALEKGKEYRDLVVYKDAKQAKEDGASGSNASDASTEELRQVIQVLLKDSVKQASILQELEQNFRKVSQDWKDGQEDVVKLQRNVEELQKQLDTLLAEREAQKKEIQRLELKLSDSGQRDGGGAAKAPLADGTVPRFDAFESSAMSSSQASLGLSRGPTDALTMLKEIAPTMPSIDTVPRGDDVTIVCTAVQSISRLWDLLPQEMPTVIALHNRIILEEIPKHKGYQVKTAGEEFMVAFHETNQALNFAMAVQENLLLQLWPQKISQYPFCATVSKDSIHTGATGDLWRGLRVAMGVHFGPVHVELNPITNGYDYMGPTVNKALMLKRISHGGMAAVSKEVYERITAEMDDTGENGIAHHHVRSHSLSYAENQRRQTTIRSKTSQSAKTALCGVTTAFHCKIPSGRNAAADVFCVLPLSLEDRLADIQAATKAIAEAHGLNLEETLQPTTVDEQPSELETMLGTFSRTKGMSSFFVTSDGVEDAATLLTDEEQEALALQRAGLPRGTVSMLCVRCEATHNKKFTEKILAKDMEALLEKFHSCVELASGPYNGRSVDIRKDVHVLVFPSVATAVKCALAIDVELTTSQWPKFVESYKETEEVRWKKGHRIFAGLRPSMGLHTAMMEPQYDHMTRSVGYRGFAAFVAYRLAAIAKPGQLLVEESVAYNALALVHPMPLFSHLTPNAASHTTVSSRLCVIMSRSFIGRHFYWSGMEKYEHCNSLQFKALYKRMRNDLLIEDIRWKRDATRVVARPQLCQGFSAPPPNAEAADALEDESGVASLLGLGEKLDAMMAKAGGEVTHAMEQRLRDLEVIQIFETTLLAKLRGEGLNEYLMDQDPTVAQLEKLEHNGMALHDPYYDGELVAFQPLIVDTADLRELPLKGTSRDVVLATPAESAPNTGRRKSESEWTDTDDDGEEKSPETDTDEDEDALANANSELFHDLDRAGASELSRHATGGITDEEVQFLKKRLVVLEEEVLLAHRIVRTMFQTLKDWMEPLLTPANDRKYVMPDDEVVSKLIAADRTTREPYLVPKKAPAATAAGAKNANIIAAPKSTRQLWRQIIDHAVLDAEAEQRMRGKGGKLLKSMESMVCRHFLFLRQYVKRIRMREREQRQRREQ